MPLPPRLTELLPLRLAIQLPRALARPQRARIQLPRPPIQPRAALILPLAFALLSAAFPPARRAWAAVHGMGPSSA